ncbi:MAG: hypothetical protein OSB23_08730, partial [Porticoccaceae bacterium]|nr:hypothetical protein [Porticoccaceae bacterium]
NAGLSRRRSRVRVPSGPPLALTKPLFTGVFLHPQYSNVAAVALAVRLGAESATAKDRKSFISKQY